MASSSPGNVKMPEASGDATSDTPDATRAPAQAAVTPVRASAKKRARDSPAAQARTSALTVLGNLTDTVRATAVRGLRAFTDSIERTRDDDAVSGSSSSGPPSPTDGVRAVTATPDGKRRRTALTDALTRRSHADWRGARWDFTSAMRDNNLAHVGDTGPSIFAFPEDRPPAGDGLSGTQLVPMDDRTDATPPRPPSAMSAASAPAVLTTPSSRAKAGDDEGIDADPSDHGGWIVAAARVSPDPFAMPGVDDGERMLTDITGNTDDGSDDERSERFIRAVRDATALLSHDTVNSPDACGALLAFQARLRALDPYGNFTSPAPAGDSAAVEMRELRRAVEEVAAAQRASAATLHAIATQRTQPPAPGLGAAGTQHAGASARAGNGAARDTEQAAPGPTPDTAGHETVGGPERAAAPAPAPARPLATKGVIPRGGSQGMTRAIGRHDERRAVFRPAVPFGGRLPVAATPDDVRRLNLSAYLVRDEVNAALQDTAVERMDESLTPVQVTTVNWTDRGNLCMITCEAFTAAELLLHADVAAGAARLGPGWKASRDVPVFKAVLSGVPTKHADGRLFTEDEILADLRAHSTAFNSLTLADAAEPAGWVSRDDERARRDHSTLALNLATAADAGRLLAMKRCLFAFGHACEPGEFQPRPRERICRRCWNPLARHREKGFDCVVRCRLCGKRHAEEDHACHECDVLSRPCAHIPLRCVNCTRAHAADDGACEFRRRMRGTSSSAPPMSAEDAGSPAREKSPGTAGPKRKKGKRVRILDPHEPFPEDAAQPPTLTPEHDRAAPPPRAATPPSSPPPTPAPGADASPAKTPGRRKRPSSKRRAASRALAAAGPPSPTQDRTPAGDGAAGAELDPWSTPAHGDAPEPTLDEADIAALEELVGDSGTATPRTPAPLPSPAPEQPSPVPGNDGAPARRASLPRAAADADRDARRRRAAHVLRREFSFMKLAEAIAALRTCSDDYASAVSWAVEEMTARRKPGMQGKSAATLQRLVADMSAAAAKDTPRRGNDTPSPSVDA